MASPKRKFSGDEMKLNIFFGNLFFAIYNLSKTAYIGAFLNIFQVIFSIIFFIFGQIYGFKN